MGSVESIHASKVGRNLKSRCGSGYRCVQRGAHEDPWILPASRTCEVNNVSLEPQQRQCGAQGCIQHALTVMTDVGDPMSRPKTGRSGLGTYFNHRVSELGMRLLTRCVFPTVDGRHGNAPSEYRRLHHDAVGAVMIHRSLACTCLHLHHAAHDGTLTLLMQTPQIHTPFIPPERLA